MGPFWERCRAHGGRSPASRRPRGDRVFIQLENCPQTLIARFAGAWISAIVVLGNPALAAPETRDLVEACGARAAIGHCRAR